MVFNSIFFSMNKKEESGVLSLGTTYGFFLTDITIGGYDEHISELQLTKTGGGTLAVSEVSQMNNFLVYNTLAEQNIKLLSTDDSISFQGGTQTYFTMFDGTTRGQFGYYIAASSQNSSNNLVNGKMGFSVTTTGDTLTGGIHYGFDAPKWFFDTVDMYQLNGGLNIDNMTPSECQDLNNWTFVSTLTRV